MFEGTVSVVPSIWASVNRWFTPAVFFVLLNLTIGTIFVTSCFAPHPKPNQSTATSPDNTDDDEHAKQQQSQSQSKPKLDRSPSVLQRLKSINLYAFRSPEAPVEISIPIPIPAVKSGSSEAGYAPFQGREGPETEEGGGHGGQTRDKVFGTMQERRRVNRAQSDKRPVSGREAPVAPSWNLKRSASAMSAFDHLEREEGNDVAVENRRPATVREVRAEAADDHKVDAKADDFINKFRQQLQLQRLDSNTM